MLPKAGPVVFLWSVGKASDDRLVLLHGTDNVEAEAACGAHTNPTRMATFTAPATLFTCSFS